MYTSNTDLAISLNKDTIDPDPMVFVLFIVRSLLGRLHNVADKKRDASTDLPRQLHGYMKQHNVDFIGVTST